MTSFDYLNVPKSPSVHSRLITAMTTVGIVHVQMKKSETAKLRINLLLPLRRDGFFAAQINARMFPEM